MYLTSCSKILFKRHFDRLSTPMTHTSFQLCFSLASLPRLFTNRSSWRCASPPVSLLVLSVVYKVPRGSDRCLFRKRDSQSHTASSSGGSGKSVHRPSLYCLFTTLQIALLLGLQGRVLRSIFQRNHLHHDMCTVLSHRTSLTR